MNKDTDIKTNYMNNDNKVIRPDSFDTYIGQQDIIENLNISIISAKQRNTSLEHILFYGPPGLGKTTLANIIAHEMNSNIKVITGTSIEKSGDIAAIITSLEEGDILFIDEIHRIPKIVEESIYSAMEDYKLHIKIGRDTDVNTITIDLPNFTLIGATTRNGMLTKPLRDRFSFQFRLKYYTIEELSQILMSSVTKINKEMDLETSYEIARRSRSTPRIAINLLKRLRDYSDYKQSKKIEFNDCLFYLDNILKINKYGYTEEDIKYMNILKSANKPLGIKTISSLMNEDIQTIEDTIEPYLIENEIIEKTASGRIIGKKYV